MKILIRIIILAISLISLGCKKNGLVEIPLNKISENLKYAANQSAKNIVGFCNNEEDFSGFQSRSSPKSFLQFRAGKYDLTCYVFNNEISSEIELGELYKVNLLKAGVKRFKYKLNVFSEKYSSMELHVDINSFKYIANYKIHGKLRDEEKWISVLDELELEVRKFIKSSK